MVNSKSISTKFLTINTLKKVLAIIGCFIFVFSFVYPLYQITYAPIMVVDYEHYFWQSTYSCWSFKVHVDRTTSYETGEIQNVTQSSADYWFNNYWSTSFVGLGAPRILILLFIVQILTLIFGLASVIFNRRALPLAPLLLSLATIVLTVYAGWIMHYSLQPEEYLLGYYLLYPSAVLFACAFGLHEATARRSSFK